MRRKFSLLMMLLIVFPLVSGQTAQPGKRLWVLRETGELIEYDPATWATRNAVKVPAEAIKHPGSLAINPKGQLLFSPPVDLDEAGQLRGADKIWVWNGNIASTVGRGAFLKTDVAAGNKILSVEKIPRCYLATDGQSLFWSANEFRVIKRDEGIEESVSTSYRVWQTDMSGIDPKPCVVSSFPSCQCETSVCQETCPEAEFWSPIRGVDDFFLITQLVPGQLGSTYQASSLYRKSGGKWVPSKLRQVPEEVLDGAMTGAVIVHRRLDGGCCGWDNVSNDQTLLHADGRDVVIFDELRTFANPDYDISFYTPTARLSPDARSVAMTISSTATSGSEIRLSESGKPNPDELSRIRRAISDLPMVEVVSAGTPSGPRFSIKHSTLAGWLSDKEILVVENGFLVAVGVPGGVRRESGIRVAHESLVFVR